MQITADMNKICKTIQRNLIFIFDVLIGSTISFVSFLVPYAVEMLLVSHKMLFLENEVG